MRTNLLAATAFAALALALPSTAQSPLCCPTAPPWSSNNGGATNVTAMFDLTVTTAVLINQLDVNLSATAGTAVNLEIYTTPGTYIGNELNPAVWTLVATDTGGVTAAGQDIPTSFTLASTLSMTPGNYGFAVRVLNTGQRYNGTGTGGTPVTVSNNELSITTGAVTAGLFSGTLWSIRTFNGCIHYTPASGLYPNFSATPTAGSSPLAVQFTDTTYTSDPGGVTSWAWDFDNDGIVDSNAQNPPHTYPNGGTYSVSLMVTDNTHGMQSITKTDYIVVDPISVDFTATPTTGAAPLAVQFTDTSTGNPVAWQWDFDNDGTIDSTAQNPAHTYVNPGLYTVSMTATNGGNQGTETKVDVINVIGSTNNTRSPEILEFQFNEARGATVNNTASTNLAPPTAVVAQTNGTPVAQAWQADPGRIGFGGNEPGFGCLGADSSSPYEHRVDTGWPIDITGSHTIMFWANNTGSSGSSYAFGSGSGSSGRCWYTTSGYMSLRSWGTLGTSYVDTATDPAALTGWNHWAVVIDDAAGTAQWYLNGAADGTGQTFTPNSFTYQGGNFTIGSYGTTTASFFTRYWEMDDFRLYARALTPAELMTAMAAENPTTAIFGDGCIGPSVVPSLSASGGAPAVGNAAFTIDVAGLEAGVPQALNLGVLTVSGGLLPYDLGVLLANFTGCFAETLPDISVSLAGGSTANVSVPIPNIPAIAGSHAYVQTVVLGSTGAVSPVLDINLQM